MVFKSGDDMVGKVHTDHLAAWWVEETDGANKESLTERNHNNHTRCENGGDKLVHGSGGISQPRAE